MNSTIRVSKDREHPYVVVGKSVTDNAELTWEARGLLVFLLGKPDNWQVNTGYLEGQSPAGRDKTRRILRELQTAGYLTRTKRQDEQGRWVWESVIYETPRTMDGKPVDGERTAVDGKRVDGKGVDTISTDPISKTPEAVASGGRDAAPVKKPRASSRVPDPRSRHVAILAVKAALGGRRMPPVGLYDAIIGAVGDRPDIGKMRKAREAWLARGYNANAWTWLLEWYVDGIPQRPNGRGKRAQTQVGSVAPVTSQDMLARAEASVARLRPIQVTPDELRELEGMWGRMEPGTYVVQEGAE